MQLVKTSRLMTAAMVLALPAAAAPITIDLTTSGATGTALDNGTSLTDLPLTVDVDEDPDGTLQISVKSASSFDPAGSTVNGASDKFGINSPTPAVGSENASQFDVDAAETMEISFNFDVNIISIEFISLSGDDAFTVGSVTGINDGNTDSADLFTFAGTGIFLAAGDGLLLEATGPAGTTVGIENITVEVVPEPGSLALFGLGGLLIARRRRA